ncbi:MAG TPA: hypothetical protein DIV36_02120, partial [Verrucomicrobiales bacterium]|nr:hypothetical protein [Verrucomicrobiales bacterium]
PDGTVWDPGSHSYRYRGASSRLTRTFFNKQKQNIQRIKIMPAKIYSDKDADLNVLKGKTLAVLGFGS